MIDERNECTNTGEQGELPLPPPAHFDESACASAQPVQQIRAGGGVKSASRSWNALASRTKKLIFIIVGALVIVSLAGATLVRQRQSTDAEVVPEQSSAGSAASEDVNEEVAPKHPTEAAQTSSIVLQGAVQNSSRIRRQRIRPRTQS